MPNLYTATERFIHNYYTLFTFLSSHFLLPYLANEAVATV
jgi:hypothetical protein